MSSDVGKPAASEYAPYYERYIALVTDPDILAVLEKQTTAARKWLETISAEKADYRYAPGKWSVKEVLGHMIDTERVFSYRALRFARGDNTELPGFDQDTFAANANYHERDFADIIQEYVAVRSSTVLLFRHLPRDHWDRRGVANGKEVTVRALAFTTAGHELHHLQILKTRYLGDTAPVSDE